MADNAEDFSNKSSDHICYDLVHYESNLHEVSNYHLPVVRALISIFSTSGLFKRVCFYRTSSKIGYRIYKNIKIIST